MALFATAEEKEAKRKEKEEKDFEKLIKRYNLNHTDKEDYEILKNISRELAGSGIGEFALNFGGSMEDRLKINRLAAIQEQNWIIINQLMKLNENIAKLIEQKENK